MLYRRALGAAFDDLPAALRHFHMTQAEHRFRGHVDVTQGNGAARLAVRLAGFPVGAGEMPLTLRLRRDGAREVWERCFDGHVARSVQWLWRPGIIAERVGPVTLLMRPAVAEGVLRMPVVGMLGAGIHLPARGLLKGGGVERVGPTGAIQFDVTATAPILGHLIRYRGDLTPDG
jgi:hypothetical protein